LKWIQDKIEKKYKDFVDGLKKKDDFVGKNFLFGSKE
jgi:hypothetical protein